jgi:hypothetical protein
MSKIKFVAALFISLCAASVANAADKPYTSCQQLVKQWLKNYPPAKTYASYSCETNVPASEWDSTLIISGKPTPDSEDTWYYSPKLHEITRNTNGSRGPILNASTFKTSTPVNEELPLTPESCSKIKSWSTQFEEGVATAIGTAVSDLDFRRTKFGIVCDYIVSTSKGTYQCMVPLILQPSEKGKKTFAGSSFGGIDCRKM